jgi:hypothetical protein
MLPRAHSVPVETAAEWMSANALSASSINTSKSAMPPPAWASAVVSSASPPPAASP